MGKVPDYRSEIYVLGGSQNNLVETPFYFGAAETRVRLKASKRS